MAFEKIIVLDDELIIRKTLEQQLRKKHYAVATASKLSEAEQLLAKDRFDLMFVDVRLPDGEGTQLLDRYADDPNAPVMVFITGFGTIESAVECMKKGAFDYIVKPCSMDEIEVVLKRAEDQRRLETVSRHLSLERVGDSELVGDCSAMKQLRRMIGKVAATEATVLVTGENGTGKEMVAGELYRLGPRSGRPYIKVNCAAISETLIESEFFGHEKGAFTGATERREGRFELAHGGTILLDEIGEIPPRLQAKLLRVLQESEFERVGGNRTMKVDVRVIATTNRDLVKAVEKGEFREDLYYRLNVFPILVPPLRERGQDILLLAEKFLDRCSRKHGVRIPSISDAAAEVLLSHRWPGNVRELQNTIERAVILSEPERPLRPDVLGIVVKPGTSPMPRVSIPSMAVPEETAGGNGTAPEGEDFALEEIEKRTILRVLERTGGKRAEAAELLKISPRTLRNKINQYRLEGVAIP